MDAFKVHEALIEDYRKFTEGFVDIRDERIRESVRAQAAQGAQWPDPWMSLNPSFEGGGTVDDLVRTGLLHPSTSDIFRMGKGGLGPPRPLTFHRHQGEAIEVAATGASYALTTGTGSGKSLAYIVPIVDRVLRQGSGKGVKAIVVYPMNALANSQREELRKFLHEGFGDGNEPVTFERYTGQESEEDRMRILADPPDILLTNYVMLELVLTRPKEREKLLGAARGLQFLVLDELHTYRGRQGADVAMLVRRVREATGAGDGLQCIGTSATMSTAQTVADQRREVAEVASRIFGTHVAPQHVITESLVRATTDRFPESSALAAAVDARGDAEALDPALGAGYEALRSDVLASWIEDTFGLTAEPGSGILVRSTPRTVEQAGAALSDLTGRRPEACRIAIRQTLLAGSRTKDTTTDRPLFAFRLHQFISKGASVYVTAEPESERAIEHEYQVVVPSPERRLFPLAFCRECGQEYLMVRHEEKRHTFMARTGLSLTDEHDGYLFIDSTDPWPADAIDRLPASWLEDTSSGPKVIASRRKKIPVPVRVGPTGQASRPDELDDSTSDVLAAWIPGALLFCLRCGVTYNQPRTSELSKVVALDQEGRSSAMTVLSTSIVRSLDAAGDLPKEVRKLLTFVDNRQDASLQAGHVNDFALVGQLRAAVFAAAKAAEATGGLDPLEFAETLPKVLNLNPVHYAQNPGAFDLSQAKRALRQVVALRAMLDLKRGWRVTLPNLEQTGLVRVHYPIAERFCRAEEFWATSHPHLQTAAPGLRYEIVQVLLDELRRVLAIDTDLFSQEYIDRLRTLSREHLTGVWTVEDNEQVPYVGIAAIGSQTQGSPRNVLSLSARGAFGRWLAREFPDAGKLDLTTANEVIESLVPLLADNGFLTKAKDGPVDGYRLKAHQIRLLPGTGEHGAPDPVRRTLAAEKAPRVVPFFRDLYQHAGSELAGLVAREHTAQVRAEDRERREELFRTGDLKLLYCSPTMELGVDIASLNAVAMRNVPPTPANYAQRSGRAGRSGQPAVVVTYCASGNAHDSYYFKRSDLMVAGRVLPPRIDLANEDLLRSHVHAIWLACTPVSLGRSMKDVVDVDKPGYPVTTEMVAAFADLGLPARASAAAHAVLNPLVPELQQAAWWTPTWVDDVVAHAAKSFDEACARWRSLDSTARSEMEAAYKMASDASLPKKERQNAEARQSEARRQRDLLLNEMDTFGQGDFYPYRYFASEGFLPGYSFPRLPLAAYVPGQRGAGSTWLQRPRFLALREFGPNALVYHEGARYQVFRVTLPRAEGAPDQGAAHNGHIALTQVRLCLHCGYHHERQVGVDVCDSCGRPLEEAMNNLLPMQTVITRRRDRISADEEERQRAGFEMVTTYRFLPRGTSPGSVHAEAREAGVGLLDVRYGDAAELRVTNIGPRKRATSTDRGFWLDTVRGQWLSDARADALDKDASDDDTPVAADVTRKVRVIPYVEDRRNIAVLRWTETLTDTERFTLMFAIERGVEAVFQLEDSELTSEQLPDDDDQGRFLLIEAAEGGAGVLRRLYAEDDALRRVATEALRIMHVDPATGQDEPDACVMGCYRCLLTYGNQRFHELVDRRQATSTLLRLARSTTVPDHTDTDGPGSGGASVPTDPAPASPGNDRPLTGRAAELVDILGLRGLRQPTRVGVPIDGLTVDLAFDSAHAVVLFDSPGHHRDVSPLVFSGWHVVRVGPSDTLDDAILNNPSVFGRTT